MFFCLFSLVQSHPDFDFPVFEDGGIELPPHSTNMIFLLAVIITSSIILLLLSLAYYAYCWQEKGGAIHGLRNFKLEGNQEEIPLNPYPYNFEEASSNENREDLETEKDPRTEYLS